MREIWGRQCGCAALGGVSSSSWSGLLWSGLLHPAAPPQGRSREHFLARSPSLAAAGGTSIHIYHLTQINRPTCSAMPFADKLSQLTKNEKYKKVETSLWRAFDPLGKGMNKIAGSLGAESFYPCELAEGEIDKAARILRTFTLEGASADDSAQAERNGGVAAAATNDPHAAKKTQKVLRKIPAKAIQGACGVAIFTCFRTGLGWSGASGSGLVVARLEDGSWSPPSGILIHTLAYGLLFGVDIVSIRSM